MQIAVLEKQPPPAIRKASAVGRYYSVLLGQGVGLDYPEGPFKLYDSVILPHQEPNFQDTRITVQHA